jgi:hypothetical protein
MTHQAPQGAHSAHPEGLCERGVARGTFKTNHYGIEFFYRNTLDRDWLTPCAGQAGFNYHGVGRQVPA